MSALLNLSKFIDEYVSELTARQEATTPGGIINHRVNERRLGTDGYRDTPCSIYFYYVRVNDDNTLYVSHHFYPHGDPSKEDNPPHGTTWSPIDRDEDVLRPILRKLALDARKATPTDYPPNGFNFDRIEWRRKSYIAIFLDEVTQKLHSIAGNPSVVFITDPASPCSGLDNHTFFDSMELLIKMPIDNPRPGEATEDDRSAIVFINHMKRDDSGNDLVQADGPQHFGFEVIYSQKTAVGLDNWKILRLDPDGNNLGPPIAPP